MKEPEFPVPKTTKVLLAMLLVMVIVLTAIYFTFLEDLGEGVFESIDMGALLDEVNENYKEELTPTESESNELNEEPFRPPTTTQSTGSNQSH